MEHKPPLEPGSYYHIYNRGLNKSKLFLRDEDFVHFIELMKIYLVSVTDIYSYALIANHFHIALRIKPNSEIGWLIPENAGEEDLSRKWSTTFDITGGTTSRKKPVAKKMLQHMLNAYAKWFNGRYHRSGKLFEERHERKIVNSDDHLRQLIIYINRNPVKHKVTKYHHEYPWISFHPLVHDSKTWLSRSEVLEFFGGKEMFIAAMNKIDFDDWLKELEYDV